MFNHAAHMNTYPAHQSVVYRRLETLSLTLYSSYSVHQSRREKYHRRVSNTSNRLSLKHNDS